MSKLEELQEMIRSQSKERLPDLPGQLLASEEGWNEVLEAIEPRVDAVARRAGPMVFDGITVVIDPELPPGEFKLLFLSDLRR